MNTLTTFAKMTTLLLQIMLLCIVLAICAGILYVIFS
jgi:hypothetical protein